MRIAIGTRKGLWTAKGDESGWEVSQPLRDMAEFASVSWMPRGADVPPRLLVGARSWFWGPTVMMSDDDGATFTEPAAGSIVFPEATGAAVERVWNLTPDGRRDNVVWAGCEPHSLWRSDD
ncbi:MAG: exo-alpha-sialidase, partial [bacterium]|nr:exo-alpha-sialidase [bacterium]